MTTAIDEAEERAYAKVAWRLLPFLGACYLIAYLDRVNVSFAKLHMLGDLAGALIAATCKDYGLRMAQSSPHGE